MAKAKKTVTPANQYEAMFLLGSAFATDLDGALKIIRSIVEKHEGQILVLKKWDERKLAYEISGQKRGLYVLCYFKGPGPSVSAIEREVNLSDQIIRVLVTKADHLNETEMNAVEPQPIIPREERPSWDRPYEDRAPMRGRGPRQEDSEPAASRE
jgi:small subunit ribosomal protein S6